MKIKNLIISFAIFVFCLANNSFAKTLPPGTGTQADVPSNLLILLDASGSMGWRMSSAQSVNYPMQSTTDSSGNIFVSQYYIYGVKKFTYANKKIDTNWGDNGVHKGRSSSSQCRVYYNYGSAKIHNGIIYVPSYYDRKIRMIKESDGSCLGSITINQYIRGFDIHTIAGTAHLFALHSGGVYTRNLSNNVSKTCSHGNNNYLRYTFAAAANSETGGNYLYTYYANRIARFELVASGNNFCPQPSSYKTTYRNMGSVYGMTAHPTNAGELYFMSYSNSKLYKVTVAANGISHTLNWTKGSRRYNGTSSSSALYFYYPLGVHYDDFNNRLITSGYNSRTVEILDDNGDWIKTIGGAATTRMKAAQDAIKSIVVDSDLTSGVNFGFGMWSSGSAGFSSWSGHKTTGTASPCTRYNCLKVQIHKDGAARINQIISSVSAVGGTDADAFMKIGQQYYNSSISPIDTKSPCQKSYIIVIGDGDWYNHSRAVAKATALKNKGVKTFAVAFGTGISSSGKRNFDRLAAAGGTTQAIVATTADSLKTQLKSAISQIIASKLSFSAPAITATLNSSGSLYQAQFDYAQNQEWSGTIKRTKISSKGIIDKTDSGNWSAVDKLPAPSSRKIWTTLDGKDYKTAKYNNFIDTNNSELENLFTMTGESMQDYHQVTNSPNNRCRNTSGVADGTDDEVKGLVNFIRGIDYFDYDADCNLTETRKKPMGDIYHSQLVVVGKPSAETAFTNIYQEAYWRNIKSYEAFAQAQSSRKEVLYAGSNSGVLHAIDGLTGVEKWGFVPPFVASQMPKIINPLLNITSPAAKGGSNAVYGVDGSPVQHDIFFKSPHDSTAKWHTVLFAPYGRGGSGFSVLDITDPDKPEHLVSIYNNLVQNKVFRMDYANNLFTYDYVATQYALSESENAVKAGDNFSGNPNTVSLTCDDTGSTACYKSNIWTFKLPGTLTNNDFVVYENGVDITSSVTPSNSSGDLKLTFNKQLTFDACDSSQTTQTCPDPKNNSPIGLHIKPGTVGTGTADPNWNYSQLGETWSEPRMFRMPNQGAGDTNVLDDISVAVMGAGYGTQYSGTGNGLLVINLQDETNFGKLELLVPIEDMTSSDIINSVPASVSLVTADTGRGADYSGGLVYTSDLEGKITKVNLTNLTNDINNSKSLTFDPSSGAVDTTTLFKAGSTKANGRYMYYPMDIAIGKTTNNLWLFAGTGDAQRLNDRSSGTDNLLIGIQDPDYPYYGEVKTPGTADDISNCKDTTSDQTGKSCPTSNHRGWYIKLKDYAKTTAEPTVNNGLVYFPTYTPSKSANKCDLGNAFICVADDECGTHKNFLKSSSASEQSGQICTYVGKGVLSKIVFFAGKLFANISGKAIVGPATDLVSTDAATGEVQTYRKSWRENF
ncbi:PilC/PilY family type IV pilus protein [Candidatus Pelagibacter sp.]|nr:PilC/PilY family type IV pilus protein [Candidatus Pelagibacter sp.]